MEKLLNDLGSVLSSDLVSSEDSAFVLYDLDGVESVYRELIESFPQNTLHAVAIKACPLPFFLKLQADFNLGAEAASIEEVHLALKSGVPCDKVVFDGPAKTRQEIEFCVKNAIYINIDSFEELVRVAEIAPLNPQFKAGLRFNPQVGQGKIATTSVATRISKFGVVLEKNHQKIKTIFEQYDWLVGAHVHIGSQGMSLSDLVAGTSKVAHFALGLKGLEVFDIGGGLPVYYREGDMAGSFEEYIGLLKKECPQLFERQIKLITELGRRIYANQAIAVSRVEYVKEQRQIIGHLGADMFLRPVYCPKDWGHRFSVTDSDGKSKEGKPMTYDIAGPLCFGGDFIGKQVSLPHTQQGDHLIIHDVGAYTLSMWSRHCSRALPKVIGVRGREVTLIKKRESFEDVFQFWGGLPN